MSAAENFEKHIIYELFTSLGDLDTAESLNAWTSVTPEFRAIISNHHKVRIPEADEGKPSEILIELKKRVLESVSLPVAVADADSPFLVSILNELRQLESHRAHAYIELMWKQHKIWFQKKDEIRDRVLDFAPEILAQLAAFNGPLPPEIRKQLTDFEVYRPAAAFLEPGEDLSKKEALLELELKTSYLAQGVVLQEVEVLEKSKHTSHVGCKQLYTLPSGEEAIVIFDLDLTDPRLSFLGLKGTRLRICDLTDVWSDKPVWSRVDLEGNVSKYHGEDEVYKAHFENLAETLLVPGRALISRYEGLNEAGNLGSPDRVGGAPAWEQYPDDPTSPVSGEAMTFIGQCSHPQAGTAYAFLDYENLIAHVVKQDG